MAARLVNAALRAARRRQSFRAARCAAAAEIPRGAGDGCARLARAAAAG
jgi:hypothetical protein